MNDQPVLKAGAQVAPTASVVIIAEQPRYVCRAGLKLEAALAHWGIDVAGKAALDAGLSTGGFTDCLLQHGAAGVVGVDVGYGQVRRQRSGCGVGVLRCGRAVGGGGACRQARAAEGPCKRGTLPRGTPQVAERVRTDPRVRVMERTNLRALRLPDIGGAPVHLVTLDLSFISVLKVLDAVRAVHALLVLRPRCA